MFAKATVLAESGDTKAAIAVFEEIEAQKKTTTGQKVDIAFSKLRIAFAGDDLPLMTKAIEKAKEFVEVGGDWERRNRLKVVQSIKHVTFCRLFVFFLFSCGLHLISVVGLRSSVLHAHTSPHSGCQHVPRQHRNIHCCRAL